MVNCWGPPNIGINREEPQFRLMCPSLWPIVVHLFLHPQEMSEWRWRDVDCVLSERASVFLFFLRVSLGSMGSIGPIEGREGHGWRVRQKGAQKRDG